MKNNIQCPGNKHLACVVLVDSSGSMKEDPVRKSNPIGELNEGLRIFGETLNKDTYAKGVVDVCVINFNTKIQPIIPFSPASDYVAPHLEAEGLTSMNGAILAGLDALEQRKLEYKKVGVDYWRPWMFLMTDGTPTDTDREAEARQRLQDALDHNKLTFFPMGIGECADIKKLRSYTKNGSGMVFKAKEEYFKEVFVWLSKSLTIIGNSKADTSQVPLPPVPDCIVVDV